jgi:hypothetical protein
VQNAIYAASIGLKGGAMGTYQIPDTELKQVVSAMEETVECGNLLALELMLHACRNEESSGTLLRELGLLRQVADRAATASKEMEQLIRSVGRC